MRTLSASQKFKDTPVGRIPVDWECLTLSEIATINRGKFAHRPRNEPRFYGGKMPFVQTGDVNAGGGWIREYTQTLNEHGVEISRVFPKGTILMAIAANIGDCGVLSFDSACPDSVVGIEPGDSIEPFFLSHFLEWIKPELVAIAPKAAQANLNIPFLARIPVPVPPLPEQRWIAEFLLGAEDEVATLCSLRVSQVEHRHGLMQHLLTGKRRFKEFSRRPWVSVRIGELLRPEDRYVDFDDEKLYRLASIRRRSGGLFAREALQGREIKTKVLKAIHSGDFIISRMQVVHGALGAVPSEFDRYFVSDSYEVLVLRDPARLDMAFFNYLSQRPEIYRLALVSSHGVHIEKMTFVLEDFLHEKVSIPPTIEEQRRIAEALKSSDEEIALLEKQADALRAQKRGLMKKLLTGQIRYMSS